MYTSFRPPFKPFLNLRYLFFLTKSACQRQTRTQYFIFHVLANATTKHASTNSLFFCLYLGGVFSYRILHDACRQTIDGSLGIEGFARFWALVVPYRLYCTHPPALQSHAPLHLFLGLQKAIFREPVDSNVGTLHPDTSSREMQQLLLEVVKPRPDKPLYKFRFLLF
jgi:hypothetical protein